MELRAALVSALVSLPPGTPGRVSKAAALAGVKRETASRALSKDPTIEDEASRRRAAVAVVPEVETGLATRPRPELSDAVSAAALEAVTALRATLAVDSEAPGVLLAKNGAAKLLLELAGKPAPAGVLRARAESGDGRAVTVEGQAGSGIEGLIGRVLGDKPK